MLPKLPYNFHHVGIASLSIGPRRELTLVVGLDNPDYPPHYSVYVRFGGITNFAEVATFLAKVPLAKAQNAYRARIDSFDYDSQEPSKQHKQVFHLVLDMVGQTVIRCANITAGPLGGLNSQATDVG
jgi:hypothetical protein